MQGVEASAWLLPPPSRGRGPWSPAHARCPALPAGRAPGAFFPLSRFGVLLRPPFFSPSCNH